MVPLSPAHCRVGKMLATGTRLAPMCVLSHSYQRHERQKKYICHLRGDQGAKIDRHGSAKSRSEARRETRFRSRRIRDCIVRHYPNASVLPFGEGIWVPWRGDVSFLSKDQSSPGTRVNSTRSKVARDEGLVIATR